MAASPTDHDLLIKLNTQFEIFTTQYKQDMLSLKDGYTRTLADHELRINKLEKITDEVSPIETVKEFRLLQQQVHDFVVSANAYRVVGGLLGGAVVFLLTQLPNIIKIIGAI